MKPLNAAVIGLGRIGKIHSNNIAFHISNVNLKAVADPFLSKAFVKHLGVKKAYLTTKPIFEDPEIDAVVICAPTDQHVALIKRRALKSTSFAKNLFHTTPQKLISS